MKEDNKYQKYLENTKEFNECDDDYCDLDANKICDNCGKCIQEDKNYKIIKITKIVKDEE